MTPPSAQFVDRFNRHTDQPGVLARRLDQDLAFEHEAGGRVVARAERAKQRSGIHPKTRLTVFDRLTGRPADPEIGEAVGKVAVEWDVAPVAQPHSYDDRVAMIRVSREQARQILRPVL